MFIQSEVLSLGCIASNKIFRNPEEILLNMYLMQAPDSLI